MVDIFTNNADDNVSLYPHMIGSLKSIVLLELHGEFYHFKMRLMRREVSFVLISD